jgi:protein SCO1/2
MITRRRKTRSEIRTSRIVGCVVAFVVFAASPNVRAIQQPQEPIEQISLDQRLGAQVPLDAEFLDELGEAVSLGSFVDRRPVVLVPAYYRCPMLCTLVINALVETVAEVELQPGKDFQIVVFSIDPNETPTLAAEKKLNYLRRFGRNDTQAGWHFLTATRQTIDRVTDAIGYGYVYDPDSDQYAHPAAIAVLTPDGRVSRYLLGFDYAPRDLRLALVESSQGHVGSLVDQALLRCYAYDPATGKYGFAVMTTLRTGALLTVLGLAGAILFMQLRRRHRSTGRERDGRTG